MQLIKYMINNHIKEHTSEWTNMVEQIHFAFS